MISLAIIALLMPMSVMTAQIRRLEDYWYEYFNNICHTHGRGDSCWNWIDYKAEQRREWPMKKLEVVGASQLEYSVVQMVEKPSLVQAQDYCNSLSTEGSFDFKKSTETSTECSWSVESGFSFENGISIEAGIPGFGKASYSEKMTMSFSTT